MGIIKQGILGALSGKVGSVVGASWKGIDYLRALPSQVANPRTDAQLNSRTKMTMVVKFLRTCTALLRIGFRGFATRMSAFNAAASINLQQAFTGIYPALVLDFTKLLISRGNLAGATNAAVISEVPAVISFSWTYDVATPNASGTDEAMLLVYNPSKEASVYDIAAGARLELNADLNVPADWSGDSVECYIAFADMAKVSGTMPKDYTSNSVHAGTVVVA